MGLRILDHKILFEWDGLFLRRETTEYDCGKTGQVQEVKKLSGVCDRARALIECPYSSRSIRPDVALKLLEPINDDANFAE